MPDAPLSLNSSPSVLSPQSSVLRPPGSSVLVGGFYARHLPAACLPLTAALFLYGWAALATIAILLASTLAALAVWSRLGPRGRQLNWPVCLWMALLLAMILPPHLLSPQTDDWPLVPAAGIFLVMVQWVLASLGSGRVHLVPVVYLILVALFHPHLAPHWVLRPDRVLVGNLFNAKRLQSEPRTAPWIMQSNRTGPSDTADAFYIPDPAGAELTDYTSGRDQPDRFSMSPEMLLRDRLPPLEDLVLGGEPGPLGTSSALMVIVGGLFLIHMGLIDYRIPLLAIGIALVGFLILPIPVVITDFGPQWRWFAFRDAYLGWPAALALANYELFASPLLFVAFFLATSPHSRPLNTKGRLIYALLLGFLTVPAQLYGSVYYGPYVALLLVSLVSRTLDRLAPAHPLI